MGIKARISARRWTFSTAFALQLALLVCFCSQQESAGQSWSIQIDPLQNHLRSLAVSPDGSILIAGNIMQPVSEDPENLRNHMWLTKFDVNGSVVWSKTYRLPVSTQGWDQTGWDVTVDRDGQIFFVGSGNFGGILLKLKSNGDVVWSRTLRYGIDSAFFKVAALENGGASVLGALRLEPGIIRRGQALIVSFDGDGNVNTQRRLDTPANSYPGSFTSDSAGNLFLSVGASDQVQLFGLKADGAINWQRRLDSVGVIAVRPHGEGRSVWLGQDNYRPALMELDVTGQVVRSKKFLFPNPLGNITYTQTKDFCKNVDDGWTLLAAYNDQGYTARLNANWEPVWSNATTQNQLFDARVQELRTSPGSAPGYITFFNDGFGPDRINLFNDQGDIDDEECDILEPFVLETESLAIAIADSDVNSVDFEVTVGDEEPTIANINFDVDYICQSPPLIPVTIGPPNVVIPVAICIDFTGLIFPGGDPLPGPGPIDFPSIFQRQACHDVPQCPDCLTMLDGTGQQILNPDYRANLYRTARPFAGTSPGTLPPAALQPFAEALAKVPDGRFLTPTAKQKLSQKFKHYQEFHRRGNSTDFVPRELDPIPLVGFTLNLATLDLVAPNLDKLQISESRAIFGNFLTVRAKKPELLAGIAARIVPDVPTPTQKFRPCHPAVFTQIESEKLKEAGSLVVELYYGGMRFEDMEKNLALVQWKEGRVREITSVIDTRSQRIKGIADGSGVFGVMQRNRAK